MLNDFNAFSKSSAFDIAVGTSTSVVLFEKPNDLLDNWSAVVWKKWRSDAFILSRQCCFGRRSEIIIHKPIEKDYNILNIFHLLTQSIRQTIF